MQYLLRFAQTNETFRKPETDALAELHGLTIKWIEYSEQVNMSKQHSPFAILEFENTDNPNQAAKALLTRSILSFAIYELWGAGHDYPSLHEDVRSKSAHLYQQRQHESFRFEVDSFYGSRSTSEKREIIESFSYLGITGPIVMKKPQNQFMVFEESLFSPIESLPPFRLYLGRLVADSDRRAVAKYDLKKRKYISTTSMNAELSLVTANLAMVRPGSLAYDPFMGTGSFPLSCAYFGATVFGSDMDGRSIRGKKDRNVLSNFKQCNTTALYLGGFVADITNTPLRRTRCLDAIVCDPPYGIREGLKVLGSLKESLQHEVYLPDGTLAHLRSDYLPPKRPYSFLRMLDDILDFADTELVVGGRICMWMPVAGLPEDENIDLDEQVEQDETEATEYDIPQHPGLGLVSCCTQEFNKWSRRLLTYKKLGETEIDPETMLAYKTRRLAMAVEKGLGQKQTSSELNAFRQKA